jgi:glucokinase
MPPPSPEPAPETGSSGHLIGVDVGGTKVAVATLENETLSSPSVQPTKASSAADLVEEIVTAVEAARNPRTEAVGVGVPSVVEFGSGRVRSSVNLHMSDYDLREALQDRLGLPVFVDNDATLAAVGEAFDESGRARVENLVMFTVGTGIGGGLVLGGLVYRGSTGAAGELGHTLVGASLEDGTPKPGRFPQAGSLESQASGRVLDRIGADVARERPDSQLGEWAKNGQQIDGRDVVRAAREGDDAAVGALRILGERLGIGIANAINTFDPDEVVIGGGVSTAGELLVGPARDSAREFVLPGVGTRTEIRVARHGASAGVRGAALLARLELAAGDTAFASPRARVEAG